MADNRKASKDSYKQSSAACGIVTIQAVVVAHIWGCTLSATCSDNGMAPIKHRNRKVGRNISYGSVQENGRITFPLKDELK